MPPLSLICFVSGFISSSPQPPCSAPVSADMTIADMLNKGDCDAEDGQEFWVIGVVQSDGWNDECVALAVAILCAPRRCN